MRINDQSVNEVLGPPADISGIEEASKSDLTKIAFELYRETAMVAVLASNLFEDSDLMGGSLPRGQAIEVGFMVRIAKFMKSVLALICDRAGEHGEVIMALNRCITETAANLIFFCEVATDEDIEHFIKSSLRPEKEQSLQIQENIARRGSTLPIENRMLNSINRIFRNSGIGDTSELDNIPKRKDFKQILIAINLEYAYPSLQGISSHAVHGTWVDLMLHHLEEASSGFKPKPESVTADSRLLSPVNTFVLMGIRAYILKYFSEGHEGIPLLLARIEALIERNRLVDSFDEQNRSSK